MAKKKEADEPEDGETETLTAPQGNPATDHTKTAQERLDALTKQIDDMHKAQE
jgi:hypothetical protein